MHMANPNMWRAGLAALTVTSAVAALGGATVHAEFYDRGTYSYSYTDDVSECGLNIHLDGSQSGRWVQREWNGLFPQTHVFQWTETMTNVDNGRFLTIEGRGTFEQLPATNLGGTVWEGSTILVESIRFLDESGKPVLTQGGQEKFTGVFDDNGDGLPGTTPIAEVDYRAVGHHPQWEMTEEELCSAEAEWLG
jgi:hypothetical protein